MTNRREEENTIRPCIFCKGTVDVEIAKSNQTCALIFMDRTICSECGLKLGIISAQLHGLTQTQADTFANDVVSAYRYTKDPDYIFSTWCKDDVRETDKEGKLTEEEITWVLSLLEDKHDASIGINWDVISHWVDYVIDEREIIENE